MLCFCQVTDGQSNKKKGPFSNGMRWVKKKSKYGFENEQGDLIIPYKYDSVFLFTEDVAAVKIDSNWFYINKEGNPTESQYSNLYENDTTRVTVYYKMARPFYFGIALVRYHGEWNDIRLNYYNDLFGDFSCDSLEDFILGYAEIVEGNKHGIIDTTGDYLVSAIYEDVDSFSRGWVKAKLDGQWMVFNPYGECVQHCIQSKQPLRKYNSSYHTLYFPNVLNENLFDEINQLKLASLIGFMERHPNQRMVLKGNGNSSYTTMQRSWDYVYSIIEYVLANSDIRREQFIFQYGRNGRYRTVNIRPAHAGEDGPHNLPPAFPSHSVLFKH